MSDSTCVESKEAQVTTTPVSLPLLSKSISSMSESDRFLTPSKNASWRQKIGWYGIFVVAFGTVAIVGAIAFLAFLWAGIEDETTSSSLRKKIITSNRVAISITLTSLVIRLSVALQAGVFTSMFAAFLLEYGAISRHAAPELSILRSSSTGPYYMTWLLAQELSIRKAMIFALGLILATTTLLSQFTSTVLLSDLNKGTMGNESTVAFARSVNASSLLPFDGSDYWSNRLGAYPVFAEHSEPTPFQVEGLVDTGVTYRALLPYSRSEERTKLRAYSGMAAVIDVRTACVKPVILFARITASSTGFTFTGTVAGRAPVQFSETNSGSGLDLNTTFSCILAARSDIETDEMKNERVSREWTTTLCRVRVPATFGTTFFKDNAGGFLILNTTSSPRISNTTLSGNGTVNIVSSNGPWINLRTENTNYTLAASLCVTPSYSYHTGVSITNEDTGQRTEPSVTWNTTSETFNTLAVRTQLGALSSNFSGSHSSRNILKLSPLMDPYAKGSDLADANERSAIEVYKFSDRNNIVITTAAMCTFCDYDKTGAFAVHRNLIAVFQDILSSTSNPALALQAHYHALLAMAYYDFLPEADVTTNATTIFQVDMLMPTTRRGFTAVVVILYIHLVCAVFAIMLFVAGTKLSRLGDGSWMAVAQVAAGDLTDVVTGSTRLGDGEVKRRIRGPDGKEGGRDRDVRLGRLLDGRIGFVRAD